MSLGRIPDHPINQIDALLPRNVPMDAMTAPRKAAYAMPEVIGLSGTGPSGELFQLLIEPAWRKPAIWRRVVVPDTITLTKLPHVIQAVISWTDSHMHEFEIGQQRYGTPDPHRDKVVLRQYAFWLGCASR